MVVFASNLVNLAGYDTYYDTTPEQAEYRAAE